MIQVELRDLDSGLKSTERLRTSETIEHGMPVTVSFHEGRALSASLPTRVTCRVVQAEPSFKGQSASAQYKKLILENGRTVMGPTYLDVGDKIVVNTLEESYMARASKS